MGYNYKQSTQQGGLERFEGFKLLKGKSHFIERPRGEKGSTKFRVIPAMGPLGPITNPYDAVNREEFGDWLHVEPTISYWGTNKNRLTCLANCSDTPEDEKPPCEVFFWTIVNAMKANDRSYAAWKPWADKNAERDKKGISSPRPTAFIQAVISHSGGKPLKDQNGKIQPRYPAILMVPSSILNPDSPKSLVNVVTNPATGDFLGEGRIFELDYVPPKGLTMAHYDLIVETETLADGSTGPMRKVPIRPEWAKAWKPWNQILRRLTEAEQVRSIAQYFPAEAVDFALGTTRFAQYLPPQVAGAWFNKGKVVKPVPVAPVAPEPEVQDEETAFGGNEEPAPEADTDDGWGNSAAATADFGTQDTPSEGGSPLDPAEAEKMAATVADRLRKARQAGKSLPAGKD